jgi:protein-tyrosine kinase
LSRIHEALKRAEEDRAAGRTSQTDSPTAQPPGTSPHLDSPVANASPATTDQFTLEALLAQSALRTWSPDKSTMLFFNSEQARGTEEFRTLRSRLYQLREKHPLKRVLVASSLPKEGKSFVAANLAQALVRQHGRRALLIDADLRAARLHLALGTASSPGLSEYLLGETDEFGIMQRGSMENLFFVPAGRTSSNPAELIANGRLKLLLDRVESLFDWVIIDSPPVIPVSDAGIIANQCDGVLMVVRSNATAADIARKARAEFDDKLLLGVVLNGTKDHAAEYSQYYSVYGKIGDKSGPQR